MNVSVEVKCQLDEEYRALNEVALRHTGNDAKEDREKLNELHGLMDALIQEAFNKGREYKCSPQK